MLRKYLRQVVPPDKIFSKKILSRGFLFLLLLFLTRPLFSQEYAFMYIANASTSASLTNTWNTIGANTTAFTEGATSANWSYSSNYLLAGNNAAVEGLYSIKYSLSFEGALTSWEVGISINGAAPSEPIMTRTISSIKKDRGNISGILMANISQSDTIRLQIRPAATNSSFTPIHAQVVLIKAAQQSVNYYGEMHISTDQTYTNIGTAFTLLTGFAATDELSDWTFSSSALTAGTNAAGTYYVSASVSLTGDGTDTSPTGYSFEIVKNGTNNSIYALADRITSATDIGNVSTAGIVSISSGDVISLEGRAHANSKDLVVKKATVALFKLVDSTEPPYAGMRITSDQTVSISTQNEWTTVGTYTSAGTSGWSFASNVFTPSSVNTYGYHFIEYALSCTTANAGGDNVDFGVFVGSNIHAEFTTMRKLSSNTDVGALCGIGIFKVDGPDSTITLKVRNTTSTNNITIKKSLLGMQQIRYVYSDTPLPITLNNFTAVQDNSAVQLSWETATEIDNALFLVYRDGEVIASLPGAGTSSEPHYYHYTDNYVIPGKTYNYVLADVSFANIEVKHDDHTVRLSIDEGNIGKDYSIGKAYPNPFNPSTIIPVNLAREAKVNAKMYDLGGHEIMSIFDGSMNAGSHELRVESENLSAGIYLVYINIEGISTIRKISLMK